MHIPGDVLPCVGKVHQHYRVSPVHPTCVGPFLYRGMIIYEMYKPKRKSVIVDYARTSIVICNKPAYTKYTLRIQNELPVYCINN